MHESKRMIKYEGRKTRLRPLRTSDMAKSIVWRNDPEIRDNALGYRFPVTERMEQDWYDAALSDSKTRVVFAIETLGDEELIGFVHLDRIDWISGVCFLGIVIGEKAYQGKGMAADAMQTLLRYAFDCLNLRKICLEAPAFNARAIDLYTRLGFSQEGRLCEQLYMEDKYHDLVLMGLLRRAFSEKQGAIEGRRSKGAGPPTATGAGQ